MIPLWALVNTAVRPLLLAKGKKLPVPVISVGNILAGGVGKTELVSVIAQIFQKSGKRVTVASRGYGSPWSEQGGVASDFSTALALKFPDEALVLLKKNPGISMAVGKNRTDILLRHWEELSPDVVILDDGFQHFALKRDADVLVHDFSVGWQWMRDLPMQFFKKNRIRVSLSDIPKPFKKLPWIQAKYVTLGVSGEKSERKPIPKRAAVFCGIGNPERILKNLKREGCEVVAFKKFRDHVEYNQNHITEIMRWHEKLKTKTGENLPLLTTLKDYVKLTPCAGFDPLWIDIKMDIDENALAQELDLRLKESKV